MFFYTFMPELFNMSLTASVAIVFVILLRLLLKKAPKVISYALWGVVLFRLLCPVSIGSNFSVYNLFDAPAQESGTITSVIEYVPSNIVHQSIPLLRGLFRASVMRSTRHYRKDGNSWLPTRWRGLYSLPPMSGWQACWRWSSTASFPISGCDANCRWLFLFETIYSSQTISSLPLWSACSVRKSIYPAI